MDKMMIRVILKSGSEFTTKCDKFTIDQNTRMRKIRNSSYIVRYAGLKLRTFLAARRKR